MTRGAAALAALVLAGCAPGVLNAGLLRDPQSAAQDPAAPELALLELRLARWYRDNPGGHACAGVRQTTQETVGPLADESVLRARFPALLPLDRCRVIGTLVVDRETGQQAALFDVHEPEWRGTGVYRAYAGYRMDARRNGWGYYEARYERGAWRVRDQDLDIIVTGDT